MTATSPLTEQLLETPVEQRLREQSFNRSVSHLNHQDAVANHQLVRTERIDEVAQELASSSQQELLSELRDQGLLWSVVAEVVGVSDTAVRKWRKGQAIELVHRQRLRRLVAVARLHAEFVLPNQTTGFAEWLGTRIVPGFSATPVHLLALIRDSDTAGLQPLLDWMLQQPDAQRAGELLDRYLGAAWREEAREEQRFRIVTNSGGERVLLIDG